MVQHFFNRLVEEAVHPDERCVRILEDRFDESIEMIAVHNLDVPRAATRPLDQLVQGEISPRTVVGRDQGVLAAMENQRRLAPQMATRADLLDPRATATSSMSARQHKAASSRCTSCSRVAVGRSSFIGSRGTASFMTAMLASPAMPLPTLNACCRDAAAMLHGITLPSSAKRSETGFAKVVLNRRATIGARILGREHPPQMEDFWYDWARADRHPGGCHGHG